MSVPIFLKEKSEIVYFPPKQNKMTKFNQKHPKGNKNHIRAKHSLKKTRKLGYI